MTQFETQVDAVVDQAELALKQGSKEYTAGTYPWFGPRLWGKWSPYMQSEIAALTQAVKTRGLRLRWRYSSSYIRYDLGSGHYYEAIITQ